MIKKVIVERIRMEIIFLAKLLLTVIRAITNAIKPPIKGAKKINKVTLIISVEAITSKPA
jgi:hypothetical protein